MAARKKKNPRNSLSYGGIFILAEWTGLEPATPDVTGRYSNQLNYHSKFHKINGGANGTRTRDLRRDRPAF